MRAVLEPLRRAGGAGRRGPLLWGGRGFSALQPELAGRIRTQKVAVIAATGARRGGQRQPRLRPVAGRGRRSRAPPVEIVGRPGRAWRGWRMAGEFEDIRRRLEAISEELADLAMVRLRESIDAGGLELPVDERRLTRARRAVERAAAILAEPDDHD